MPFFTSQLRCLSRGCALLLCAVGVLTGCGSSGTSAETNAAGKSAEVAGETDAVSSVAEMSKGDIIYLAFSSGKSSLSFSGAPSDAQYLLIMQSAQQTASSSTLTVSDATSPTTALEKSLFAGETEDVATEFEAFLRAAEEHFAEQGTAPVAASTVSKGVSKAVSTGATGSFRVLSSLSSINSYSEVAAIAKCVNDRVAVFVDTTFSTDYPEVLSTADYDTLCAQFKGALDTEFAILGEPPDINGDGVITVLMTPKVNALGASGGGIVTGFFFAGDFFSRSSTPASNLQEIVHIHVPDPSGKYGSKISKDFAMSNLLTAVVPHEVQHLLSYNYHVMVKGGSTEPTWLNEGMSHLIEDVTGYGQENPSRVALYLATTRTAPLITSSSPDLAARGGSYLFLRFLYEQAGNDGNAFLKSMMQTNRTGVDNIVTSFGTGLAEFNDFGKFLRRWGVAMAATNAGVTSDARYIYKDRTWNSTTSHWHGICLVCDADDGRSTSLKGPATITYGGKSLTLSASATAYFGFGANPASISLAGSDAANLQGILLRTK